MTVMSKKLADLKKQVDDAGTGLTLAQVKADSDIADSLTKKHSNTLDHSGSTQDSAISGKANASHGHATTDITGTAVVSGDPRLSDARTPTSHSHAPSEVTGTAVITNDSRLSDARTPTSHGHVPGDVTGTAVVTADSRLSDARVPTSHDNTKHSTSYEVANANIQTHVTSAHAPSNAQKNSDITKAEIEAKLTGELTSHTHAGGSGVTNIKQTEIDFGTTPVSEASFLITDADVLVGSQLIGNVAYEAPTGKDLDELEMDGLDLKFAPGAGQFTLYARGLDGYVADRFKINYLVG